MGRSTVVRNVARTWLSIVQQVDPEWRKEGNRPVMYEFSNGRAFRGPERTSGAYEDE